ncbi:hypothetical protein GCM10027175_35220 [Hymenobacter latericoloratus]
MVRREYNNPLGVVEPNSPTAAVAGDVEDCAWQLKSVSQKQKIAIPFFMTHGGLLPGRYRAKVDYTNDARVVSFPHAAK